MKNRLINCRQIILIYFLLISFSPFYVSAQELIVDSSIAATQTKTPFWNKVDQTLGELKNESLNKKRVKMVAAANIIGYGGTMIGLYSDWYSNYPQSNFHFFNDNNEWKQVDKAGHAYSAYIEAYGSMEMWRWTGMSRRKSAWIGGVSALAYQSIIETLDGFSTEWGWSWGDMGANVLGTGLFIGQELAWNEQRVKYKFSFHKKTYGSPDLTSRANDIYGSSWTERMIKDYNGQTYWLSANLKSFMPQSNLPSWLSVAFGYGADGMFGAESNIGKDKNGSIIFDRSDIARYRRYYISPDIDLTKIKTHSKFLKLALGALNAFKFPLPSIEYNSKGEFAFHLIHF
ncbi:MAG: YfiM family protein [Bacteroidota bacterium]|nr:YfiM family protein [Bacteroidota bacterium]